MAAMAAASARRAWGEANVVWAVSRYRMAGSKRLNVWTHEYESEEAGRDLQGAIFAARCEFEMLGWCGAAGGGGRPVSGGTPQAACSCSDRLAVRAGLRLGCYCLRPSTAAAATSAHDRRKL